MRYTRGTIDDVLEFCREEAKDFLRYVANVEEAKKGGRDFQSWRKNAILNEAGENWAEELHKRIIAKLTKLRAGEAEVLSLSNMGDVVFSLRFSANFGKNPVIITLCTCGSLDCWGSGRIVDIEKLSEDKPL